MNTRHDLTEDTGRTGSPPPAEPAWVDVVRQSVAALRHGSVEVQVHDGRVVQVETREKVRFADQRRPDDRRRNPDDPGRAHPTPGGAAPSLQETEE